MSSISLFDTAILPVKHAIHQLRAILQKAETWADSNGVPHSELLGARLAPDMHPLTFQVQTVCNTAKFIPVRVAGTPNLPMEDNETTFEDLQKRLETTLEFLEGVRREDFEGKHDVEVNFRDFKFTGLTYVTGFAIPNFYFHVMTTYALLRMKGVPIGKMDYLGKHRKGENAA